MKELITRRMALQSLTACACVTCLSAAGLASASEHGAEKAAAGHGGAPHWGYEGEGSPEHWGDLSPDFKTCSLGTEQSPIDLTDAVKAQLGEPFKLEYRAVAGKIVNNGHSIQVNVEPGCSCTIKGKRFDLLQYHFHHPSEHLVDGRPHAMEG
ncbi:MAG: carbonic anhydrase family protein, partial [Alphaproteobacteria bacterium]